MFLKMFKFVYFLVFLFVKTRAENYEVVYQWKEVDFNFPNDSVREEMLKTGSFIPKSCVLNTLKIYGDMAFVAVARYLPGVPSTLNVIPYGEAITEATPKNPKLTPFPNWEMQQIGNCSAIQLAHGLEVDQFDRLYIVDAGRVDVFMPNPRNLCPPKLIIYDLANNKIDRIYEFPEELVPRNTSGLKDIQVGCTSREDCYVFISNINVTCSLVVYSYRHNNSWVATHSSMQPDWTKAPITINGISTMVPFGITGIGLSPLATNFSRLFYSKMAGDRIYSVETAVLMDSATLQQTPTLLDSQIQDLGVKPMGQADGAAMDNHGRWFYGSLPECALYSIDTMGDLSMSLENATRHLQSNKDLEWVDSFSFDGSGNLLFTTSGFHRFLTSQIKSDEVNYRLVRFNTGTYSYST